MTETQTKSVGAFRLSLPAPPPNHGDDRYQVAVTAAGFFPVTTIVATRSAATRIHLNLSPNAGSIRGIVESALRKPVVGAKVRLVSGATGAAVDGRTGASGRFSVLTPALPSPSATRRYDLLVSAGSRRADQMVAISPGSRAGVVIQLTRFSPATQGEQSGAPGRSASSCLAGATSWTGRAKDGKWETAGNWSNGVPTSSLYGCIPSGSSSISINSAATAAGCRWARS